MIVSALCMVTLCVFGFGQFVRSFGRQEIFLYLGSSVLLSLFLSWFVFLISFASDFGAWLPWVSIPGAAGAFVLFTVRLGEGRLVWPNFDQRNGGLALAAVILASFGVMVAEVTPVIGTPFTEWDALVSWNRWAVELSQNRYVPLNAAYPVFYPAVWSLIYEAQGASDLWYFSRLTLVGMAIGAAFLFFHLGVLRGVLPLAVIFLISYYAFFSNEASYSLYSGYMDRPSGLFGLIGLVLAFEAVSHRDGRNRIVLFMLAVVSVSLAVMTKQHGVFAALAVCGLVATQFFASKMSFRRAAALGVLFLAPIISFLAIYLQEQSSLWGNLATLNQTTASAIEGREPWRVALSNILAQLPWPVWAVIAAGAGVCIAFCRDRRTWFALAVAALVVPGFLLYADCCSYNERNGLWVFAHFAAIAYFGAALLSERLLERKLVWPGFLVLRGAYFARAGDAVRRYSMPVAAFLISSITLWAINGSVYPDLLETQDAQLRSSIEPRVQRLFQEAPGALAGAGRVLSPVQVLKYHPDVTGRYVYCPQATTGCLGQGESGDLYVTARWFENAETEAALTEWILEGRLVQLAAGEGFRLYAFVESGRGAGPTGVGERSFGPGRLIAFEPSAEAWRAREGGPPTAEFRHASLIFDPQSQAVSRASFEAKPGHAYTLEFAGFVVEQAEEAEPPVNILAGPMILRADNSAVTWWSSVELSDLRTWRDAGGVLRFSGARRVVAGPAGGAVHLAFHGPWREGHSYRNAAYAIDEARLIEQPPLQYAR